jgi:putative acyl-CoA dehydrogenase
MMRAALARAIHYARHRVAFGRLLVTQPLMRNVLADLALEVEAATALALRLARAFEVGAPDSERALARVVTPAAKYWLCKRGPALAAEAMEALGGSGYVEESALPRIYREMPVNSIWEGSGNVICLDVVRAVKREPAALDALQAEIAAAHGAHPAFDAFSALLTRDLAAPSDDEWHGRRLAQRIALSLQASLLLRHAPNPVAAAFCASRLDPAPFSGAAFGALPSDTAAEAIIDRALAN